MPWIYYNEASTPAQLLLNDDAEIDLVVGFNVDSDNDDKTDQLSYYLAMYDLQGNFAGEFVELKT